MFWLLFFWLFLGFGGLCGSAAGVGVVSFSCSSIGPGACHVGIKQILADCQFLLHSFSSHPVTFSVQLRGTICVILFRTHSV